MKVLRTYTLTRLMELLRERGMSISPETLKLAIDDGFLRGCIYKASGGRDTYIILASEVDKWLDEHCVEVTPSEEMMLVADMLEKMNSKDDASGVMENADR